MEKECVDEIMAGYEFVVTGLERAGIFFTMLSRVFETFLFFALLLFSISSFLSFIAPNVQQLLDAYAPQTQELSDDDENGAEEKEIGQKKEAEDAKDDLSYKLEILLQGILENKNQVVKQLEQEREKRHAWEKEKTRLENDVRVIKGMLVTFSEKSLPWEEERSQLRAELAAAWASLQQYQELMHHCDNYY